MSMLEEVLAYAQGLNWAIFPLTPNTKIPFRGSHGFKDATTDLARIKDWWRAEPDANIGVATTESKIVVLDLDSTESKESIKKHGRGVLPMTPHAQTPHGFHILFQHPCMPIPRKIRPYPGLDVCADGGYTILPPSVVGTRQYQWIKTPNAVQLAPLPDWLLSACTIMQDNKQGSTPGRDRTGVLYEGPIPNGARNDTLYRLGARLLWESSGTLSMQQIEDFLRRESRRCVTPLEESELRSLVRSVAKSYRG
jgi:putative DNA primase/helicase